MRSPIATTTGTGGLRLCSAKCTHRGRSLPKEAAIPADKPASRRDTAPAEDKRGWMSQLGSFFKSSKVCVARLHAFVTWRQSEKWRRASI